MSPKNFLYDPICIKLKLIGWQLVVICFFLQIPLAAWSSDKMTKEKIPSTLNPVFEYLLALNSPDYNQSVDDQMLDELVAFVMMSKQQDRLYFADGPFDMTSAYHEFLFEKDFAHVVKLTYNPELPSFLTNPSSIRLSYWNRFEDGQDKLPKFWEFLDDGKQPLIVKGHETVENTPDFNTGGYYRYGLDRALILTKHQGNNLLLSISKQPDISEVGKKGMVLGSDDDWNYLYSGKEGLNKSGLGWVKSYMYDSFSVVVYYEIPGPSPKVKCAVFKWLNAGWRKINMVKEHHIHQGLLRYEKAFKNVVENPSMSDVSAMANIFTRITDMGLANLQQIYLEYLKSFRVQHADDKELSSGWVADTVADGQVEKMDPREIQAAIMLDYIKSLLGKPHYIDLAKMSSSPN